MFGYRRWCWDKVRGWFLLEQGQPVQRLRAKLGARGGRDPSQSGH